jgi:hypothetical protein
VPATTIDTAALRTQLKRAKAGDAEAVQSILSALPAVLLDFDALNTMVALRLDGLRVEAETHTDYGVQYGPHPNNVRWDPQYEPYTLEEAQWDSRRNNGLPIVTRQRTTYSVDETETPWVPYVG